MAVFKWRNDRRIRGVVIGCVVPRPYTVSKWRTGRARALSENENRTPRPVK